MNTIAACIKPNALPSATSGVPKQSATFNFKETAFCSICRPYCVRFAAPTQKNKPNVNGSDARTMRIVETSSADATSRTPLTIPENKQMIAIAIDMAMRADVTLNVSSFFESVNFGE